MEDKIVMRGAAPEIIEGAQIQSACNDFLAETHSLAGLVANLSIKFDVPKETANKWVCEWVEYVEIHPYDFPNTFVHEFSSFILGR